VFYFDDMKIVLTPQPLNFLRFSSASAMVVGVYCCVLDGLLTFGKFESGPTAIPGMSSQTDRLSFCAFSPILEDCSETGWSFPGRHNSDNAGYFQLIIATVGLRRRHTPRLTFPCRFTLLRPLDVDFRCFSLDQQSIMTWE
jgi:hypothetical protein